MKTQILFEDKDILVCCKPAGLAVQSGRVSEPDMVSELKNCLALRDRKNGERSGVYLGIVHRLDQPVSGILVFAKTQRAAASLSRQIADRSMEKTYRAAVLWSGDPQAGSVRRLENYMVKEPGGGARIAGKDEKGAKRAKRASLLYRVLQTEGKRALLEIGLETGRYHQIRVQLANAGMPLLGDNRYGTAESRELSLKNGVDGIALQAVKLSFLRPADGKRVCYELDKKLEL